MLATKCTHDPGDEKRHLPDVGDDPQPITCDGAAVEDPRVT